MNMNMPIRMWEQEVIDLKRELAYQTDMAAQADVACVRLKALCARAADALEVELPGCLQDGGEHVLCKLITELREASR